MSVFVKKFSLSLRSQSDSTRVQSVNPRQLLWGKMSISQHVAEGLVTNRVMNQKPPCECFYYYHIAALACSVYGKWPLVSKHSLINHQVVLKLGKMQQKPESLQSKSWALELKLLCFKSPAHTINHHNETIL